MNEEQVLHYLETDKSNRNLRTTQEWVDYFKDRILPLNPEWTNLSDNDIGMLIVRLAGSIGDSLNWRVDMAELEFYIDSVRERANAASLLRLIGYTMSTYQSGAVSIKLSTKNEEPRTTELIIPKYSRFLTRDTSLIYHTLQDYVFLPNTTTVSFDAYEGSIGQEVHYSTGVDELGRIFLDNRDGSISENTVDINYNGVHDLVRVEDIYSTTKSGVFQLLVDNYGHNYIQLDTNWRSYINTAEPTQLLITYLVSRGEVDGVIGIDTIKTMYLAPNYDIPGEDLVITNTTATVGGSDPETIEHARLNAPKYARSMSSYITIKDYEDGIELSHPDILDASVVDLNTAGMGITEPYKLKCFILTKNRDTVLPEHITNAIRSEIDSRRIATIQYQLLPPQQVVVNISLTIYMKKLPTSASLINIEASNLIKDYVNSHMIGDKFSPSRIGALLHTQFKYKEYVTHVDLQNLSPINVSKGQVLKLNNVTLEVLVE